MTSKHHTLSFLRTSFDRRSFLKTAAGTAALTP